MNISGRSIGLSQPPYVIAELSANHNGSLDRALETITVAKQCGADAVKIQTYTADTMTIDCDLPDFVVKGGLWDGYKLYDLYKWAQTPYEWHEPLFNHAKKEGITLFSTPFDETAIDLLESLNTPAYKIASFELVDTELLKKVAATGKPVIMSTGMASFEEIEETVQTLRADGCTQQALLKCTSAYPSLPEDMNLRTIPHMAESFGVPVGLSDHTLGVAVPVAAVALGACIIEKHLTMRRSDGGPDGAFSLEPDEFKAMVEAVRVAGKSIGKVSYEMSEKEAASRVFRRSLFVAENIEKGDLFTRANVRSIRPGYGLPVKELNRVLGKRAAVSVARGTPLAESHLA